MMSCPNFRAGLRPGTAPPAGLQFNAFPDDLNGVFVG